jgi:hypothetical protein
LRQATAHGGLGLLAGHAPGVAFHRPDHHINEGVVIEGLFEKVESPFLEGADGHGHVSVAGEEDHRHVVAAFKQNVETLQAAHFAHPDIQHDASMEVGLPGCKEFLGR